MKTAAVVIAAIAIKAASASLDPADYFPECSVKCLQDSLKAATECAEGDDICFCKHSNYEAIYLDAYDCVIDACTFEVAEEEVLPAAEPYCEAATSAYSATATAPLPVETESEDDHDHDHEEEEDHTDDDHASTPAATTSAAKTSAAAQTTSAAAETSEAAATTEAAASTSGTPTAVPENGAAQLGSMGAAAMLVLGALAL